MTSFSSTGSRGSKSQTNTIVIIISDPIRHWLSVNSSYSGSPDMTPLYSCLNAKNPCKQDLAIVYIDIHIGQTYSCLGGQTQGGKNPGILNSPSGWLKECSVLILNQNRSEPPVPVHRTVDLFTMNTLCVRDRPKSTDRVNGRGIILLVKFHFTNHGLYI